MGGVINRLLLTALRPVDGASVVALRQVFGLLGLVAVIRFFAHGWIDALYIAPAYHFTYPGFSWVQPWPGWGMYAHFAALGILSVGIIIGWRPRLCATLFGIGFTYVELLDRTNYLNHYYLMTLVALLLAVLPHRRVDGSVPQWTLWTLRSQVGIVYLFAGIAKLNPDWLQRALPLRIWLYQHSDFPLLGPALQQPAAAYAMSWGGALFDLAIVPALLWRRSRAAAYSTLAAFHISTALLFPHLGIFPWLMMGLVLIFFDPDWPRRIREQLSHCLPTGSGRVRPARRERLAQTTTPASSRLSRAARAAAIALALYAAVQLAAPLRHYAYPGNVRWNEAGYLFAWRVMLTEKTGFVQFRVRDPATGQTWHIAPDAYLTPLQTERMAIQPDLIRQTARLIRNDFAGRGYAGVSVAADAFVSCNGRPAAQLIDPGADLAAVPPGLAPAKWVLPYDDAAGRGAR